MLPKAWSPTRLPAVRMTKRSPRFWSKTSSGALRESAHATMMANGGCAWAVSAGRAAVGLLWDTSLVANRRLPSLSLASALSALTDAAGWSAARTKAATLKQAMVPKTVSLDVVFIVRCYLFKVESGIKTVEAEQRLTRTRSATAGDSEPSLFLSTFTFLLFLTATAPARECFRSWLIDWLAASSFEVDRYCCA